MKNKLLLTVLLPALIATCLNIGCGGIHKDGDTRTGGTSVSTTAMFGALSSGGCIGRGICSAGGSAMPDTFWVNTLKDSFQMFFSLAKCIEMNPNQAKFFGEGKTSFTFDIPYDISSSNAALGPDWPLAKGTVIPSGIEFPMSLEHGIVTVTVPIGANTLSQPEPLNIIFGGIAASGKFEGSINGIYYCGKQPRGKQVRSPGDTVPASFPIYFALQPGDATQLLAYFRIVSLNAQPLQQIYFPPKNTIPPNNNTNYSFNMFALNGPDFAGLKLPYNASPAMAGNPQNNWFTSGGGWDTIHIRYGFACTPDTLVTEGANGCMVTSTTSSISVNLANARQCLFYVLQGRLGPSPSQDITFSDTVYWPAQSITTDGLQPATNYVVYLKEFQADNTTFCETSVQISTK
ncbi:MAG: hypothetical protein K0Q79_3230 [Flavipsychrobacter sp.]|jgi:hypothetical protein|nr:hypothetical protein [Flavipsychrobacter sp.]